MGMGRSMKTIEVVCTLGKNACDYASFFYKTCKILESGDNIVKYKCVNTVKNNKIPSEFECIGDLGLELQDNPDPNVVAGMNWATGKINSDYVLFCHVDMAMLAPRWDEILLSCFTDKIAVVGIEYLSWHKMYLNFPSQIFALFDSTILKNLNPDFSDSLSDPKNRTGTIMSKKEAEITGLKIGSMYNRDIGWRLPYVYKTAGYSGKCIKLVMMDDPRSKLPFYNNEDRQYCVSRKPAKSPSKKIRRSEKYKKELNLYRSMQEFHIEDKLIASHMYFSREVSFDNDITNIWVRRVKTYLKNNGYNI